jgi:hypothetical protein
MAQVSVGRLAHPERESAGDVVRSTASLHYTRPFSNGAAWSSSLIWGRNHETATHRNLNSYLAESVLPASRKNFLTARAEWVDKDELFATGVTYRIGAYTAGFTHDLPEVIRGLETGIGANATAYSLPAAIKPYYGARPYGATVFLRVRLKQSR